MDDSITSDVPVCPGTPAHRSHRVRAVGLVVALLAASLAAVGPAAAETVVIVGAGDSLSEIAVENAVSLVDLMTANNITDPDLVFMGQRLVIPGTGSSSSSAATGIRVVQWGDTLSVIAEDFGTTVSELMSLNGLSNANSLFANCREQIISHYVKIFGRFHTQIRNTYKWSISITHIDDIYTKRAGSKINRSVFYFNFIAISTNSITCS